MRSLLLLLLLVAPAIGLFSCSDNGSGTQDGGGDGGVSNIPCNATGISKGPWVMAVDDTHATMRWEACRPGTSGDVNVTSPTTMVVPSTETVTQTTQTYTAVFNPNAVPDYAGTWYMHEASFSGLTPATCYQYALAADPSRAGRFCTPRATGDEVKFFAMGDTNVGLGDTTKNIISHVLPLNPDFTLLLGDIQYYSGGFDTWALWADVMRPLLSNGAFQPAIGNHESEEPTEYTEYTLRFFHGAGFAGTDEYYRFESGGVYFFVLDTQEATDATSAQAAWFAQQISVVEQLPGYRFSIVYFHKPFLTCGDSNDDPVGRQYFEPLFIQHGVPLVLQAHMHGYERFEVGSLTYVTTAGGGGVITDVNQNIARSYCNDRVVVGNFFHGTMLDVTTGKLTGTVIDDQGTVRDTFQKTVP